MKSIIKYCGISLIAVFFFSACQNDGKSTQNAQDKTEQTQNHDHSHDGHNHDGHTHSTDNDDKYERKSLPKDESSDAQKLNKKKVVDLDQRLEEGKNLATPDEWAKKREQANTESEPKPPIYIGEPKTANTNLPSTCTLISPDNLAKIVDIDPQLISIKDGSGRTNPHSQSCFFRWDHRGVPNSGIMIQVQDNPIPDEFPEWAKYYIQAKINKGEQMPDGSAAYRYKPMDGLGDAGAYSFELNRYIWRIGSEYIFMVAFNLRSTEEMELKWAKAIGNEVMRNF